MAHNRKLITDQDFNEAMEAQSRIRVFKDDQIVDSGGTITRFNDTTIVTQSGVSDINYHERESCEFFAMKKK
ncbi:hypothetical protein [Paenibacillus abyssi]|uniref:Uncharacterized protein n=1 Tax=Paenibacillus abyssi TaxID=1340531 RepID=A0A917D619_9BACL|nr:hypothetical protein [Paenibacillus abyssi]GGG13216.1 hypothetical protein GCM10010916_32670 [Paenibacillus abyssi]